MKTSKNIITTLAIILFLATITTIITACDKPTKVNPVTGVTLNQSSLTLHIGGTETLSAVLIPANATNKEIIWSSSNSSIATVSQNGLVRGVSSGVAIITVVTLDGGYSATCQVTVSPFPSSLIIIPDIDEMNIGQTEQLSVLTYPEDAYPFVTWATSSISMATITSNGIVSAWSSGQVTITATSVLMPNITATRDITVTNIFDGFRYYLSNNRVYIGISNYVGMETIINIPPDIYEYPVTLINDRALFDKGLTQISIPNSVTSIGREAFKDNQLTSVTIGNSVTTIGDGAFQNNQLWSVDIPNSVTTIGEFAFRNNQLISVSIGNSVTTIGQGAFAGNQLKSVTIPNSVATIEGLYLDPSFGAFSNNQLTSVSIGNSVTTIGRYAFHDNLLTNVIIPNSVTEIWNHAFSSNQLISVTIGDNVSMTFFDNGGFGGNFREVYNRVGGTFTRPTPESEVWTRM